MLTVLGPTASGKTNLAVKIAHEFILHYWKILDKYTLLEFIEKITNF